jgi:hypothetical protein
LTHSTTEADFSRAVAAVRKELDGSMTRDEAWRVLATLNPVLADGHLFVGFPDWRGEVKQHLASGGTLFPFEIYVDPQGQPFIKSFLGGAPTELAGVRLNSIDKRNARNVVAELLARVHGDTPTFRTNLLSHRWWLYYWKMYGAKPHHEIEITVDGVDKKLRVGASTALPTLLAEEEDFDRQFNFSMISDDTALLTLGTFDWPDEEQFFKFTKESFTKLRKTSVQKLIIDIRNNGGGNDSMWLKGVLPYIAKERYRTGSSYKVKVLEEYRDEGETVGEVVSGEIKNWTPPDIGNPARFRGKVFVVVGPSTYSSAIVFANVVQDFGFGKLAGIGGAARTTQSGGVQKFALANTGLAVYSPRFILKRPSGAADPRFVSPEISLVDNPYQPDAVIDQFLGR